MKSNEIKQSKVVIYIPEEDHRRLKAKVAMLGLSVSEWFRRFIKKFLEE